jgi:replication-associated recombination protein RarA
MKAPAKGEGQRELLFGTKHGLDPFVCISAMQKCIRRGMEREAMEFACEMLHTSKSSCSWVCKRLEIISHEDIDTQASPHIVPFVKAASEQARSYYDADDGGHSRMMIGNAIRLMCRAPKSREGDHFQAAVGLANLVGGFVPSIPDWAYDKHTHEGRSRGRRLSHFRAEGAKLVPAIPPDAYEDEAYRMWTIQEGNAKPAAAPHSAE